jgi:DNA polymerase III epsilon subunit-like protein
MLSVAAFDLETSSLNADYGILLVGVVHTAGAAEPTVFRGDTLAKNWKSRRSDDSAVVKAVAECLMGHDVLVAHNGATGRGFDMPFLQARLAKWGLPPMPRRKIIDPVQIARNQFRLSSNSLESISSHLGLPPKMKLPPSVWLEAFLDGDKTAMDTIVARCTSDVAILVEIFKAVKGYVAQIDSRGSSW